MKLVIAEKPQLGKAIADALPGHAESKDDVIRKGEYTIIWAYGHLLTLKEPEDYDEKYKARALEDLPIYFENWGMKIGKNADKRPGQRSKADRVKQIGELLKQADCVIHAGDIDEEGQLLIDEILRWFHYSGPVWRLNTNNTTEKELQKALKRMTNNKDCEPDGWSAFGRELSDAVFGFNLTRYYSAKSGIFLPVGRVQTPTLGLVVQRDEQIENHKKTYYYELFANLGVSSCDVTAKFNPDPKNPALTDGKFLDRSYLDPKASSLNGKSFSNIQVKKETVKVQPPLPFNLTKLTTYCSRRWGYNPDDVMKITQSLRENYKAITYNRSDCQYLSDEHFHEAPETLAAVVENLCISSSGFDTGIKSRCFDDSKLTAHFAIIPTSEKVNVSKMTEREKNVYTAVCHYYLAQFMPLGENERTTLIVDLGAGESLKASSTVVVKPGFRALLSNESDGGAGEDEEETSDLSKIPAGMYSGNVTGTQIKEKETKPPARYTQASLAEDMTRIAKYVDDPEIKRLLLEKDKAKTGENGSIGTSATRPYIISNLISRGFLMEKKEGKRTVLISTPKGRDFYHMLPDEVKKADTTAKWWTIQEDIKLGKATPDQMAKDVLATVTQIIHSGAGTLNNASAYAHGGTGVSLCKCPRCGGDVIETPKAFGCSNKECKFFFSKENHLLTAIGKKMTGTIVKSLASKGRASLTNCKSKKTGNTFSCDLVIDLYDENGYPSLKLDFDSAPAAIGSCPRCGGEIVKDRFGNYSCSNWKSGCKFKIYGTIAGKELSASNVKALLTKGHTAELSGFTSKSSGRKFEAMLVLTAEGKVEFKFLDHPKKP